MSAPCWPAIKPRAIAYECSRPHIASVLTDAKLTIAEAASALQIAEEFMAAFEDDEMQEGIEDNLATIRAAIAKATGGAA
jgi:hypothetical protein